MLFLLVALLLIIGILFIKTSSGEPKSEQSKRFKEKNPEAWARGNRNSKIIGIIFTIAGIVVAVICFLVYDITEVIAGLIVTAVAFGTIWFLTIGRFKLGETKYVQNMVHEQAAREAELQAQQIMTQARIANTTGAKPKTPTDLANENKKASVAKRAAAGAIIAGETGAIIGAASAINENLKNKDK